jgi:hypothetical protein
MTPRESAFITASDRLFYHESQKKMWKIRVPGGRTLEKVTLKSDLEIRELSEKSEQIAKYQGNLGKFNLIWCKTRAKSQKEG